jgi:Uma2 family endonuclease
MSIAEAPPDVELDEFDPDVLYEVIDGVRVELPPMSTYANVVANEIAGIIRAHATPNRLGRAFVEVLFRLPLESERNRRPDVAFVSSQRWPLDRPFSLTENAWDVVPDLAIEVVSPTDRVEELADKIIDYFAANVRQVWVILPALKMVYVYESQTVIRGLFGSDELDGGAVLPGFRVSIASFFPPTK